jgi:ketosteroid isomerase-like protein
MPPEGSPPGSPIYTASPRIGPAILFVGNNQVTVSRENVERVKAGFQRWQAGDPRFLDDWDPEIEWDFSAYPLVDVPTRGRGREEFLGMLGEYFSAWHDYSATPREWIDAGDHVILVLHETARLRDSDAVIDRDVVQVWTAEGERATLLRVFKTREEALEAVGLPATTEGSP